ncbi:twin-arginine translocase subunit TatC [Anaerocolumna sp. MB42-C2]|uniref:twin-arginine translocase subunit TatC n=1 Tax=Anaerocolumna sp. MB42-C2 TaxID=3070997 RepID=UPI0027E1D7C0|nr:twin-arginine translocase subunit TatC [Anaerocolumna sp. MB42-C2]WMJ85532.1 twin-arginine translocase subunit TatC [Anaerocolumna sp. MB42-C2]
MKISKIIQINKKNSADDELVKMSLVEHLSEFRKRLIVVAVCFFISTIASFYFSQEFVDRLVLLGKGYTFIYISPSELFMQYINLSVIAGIVITSPVILFELWKFLCPGLLLKEKAIMCFAFLSGFAFFLIGAAFAYFIMVPFLLQYFLKVDTTQTIKPMISFANYVSFITSSLLTFGLIFEMPIISMVLSNLGFLKPQWLVKSRKAVIVAIFVIAAILTPPDIISQIMVAIPMLLLYELSVIVCKFLYLRRKKKRQKLDQE